MFHPGDELIETTKSARVLAKYVPSFHEFLLKYPAINLPELQEMFYWVNMEVSGRPTFARKAPLPYICIVYPQTRYPALGLRSNVPSVAVLLKLVRCACLNNFVFGEREDSPFLLSVVRLVNLSQNSDMLHVRTITSHIIVNPSF